MRMISLVNGINFFHQQRTVGSEKSFIQWLPSATLTFIFCPHYTHKLTKAPLRKQNLHCFRLVNRARLKLLGVEMGHLYISI
jgi:hypothetical protein